MKKIFVLILFSGLSAGCTATNPVTEKTITFSDRTSAEITFEIVSESKEDRVLNVGFIQDEMLNRESEVNARVHEIWNNVKIEAEREEIDEGLIKFVFLSDFDEIKQKPVYGVLLYEAVRTENGRWTIRKVG